MAFPQSHVGEIRGVGVNLRAGALGTDLIEERCQVVDLLKHRGFVFFFGATQLRL